MKPFKLSSYSNEVIEETCLRYILCTYKNFQLQTLIWHLWSLKFNILLLKVLFLTETKIDESDLESDMDEQYERALDTR